MLQLVLCIILRLIIVPQCCCRTIYQEGTANMALDGRYSKYSAPSAFFRDISDVRSLDDYWRSPYKAALYKATTAMRRTKMMFGNNHLIGACVRLDSANVVAFIFIRTNSAHKKNVRKHHEHHEAPSPPLATHVVRCFRNYSNSRCNTPVWYTCFRYFGDFRPVGRVR